MPDYKRRFSKDEFKQELLTHLMDMPADHLRNPKKLSAVAETKADHYASALAALDAAMDKVRKIAETHPDPVARQQADSAVTEINSAIDSYGEASLSQNSQWRNE